MLDYFGKVITRATNTPQMTRRYAHLREETLKRASDLAGNIVGDLLSRKEKKKVVNLEDYKKQRTENI